MKKHKHCKICENLILAPSEIIKSTEKVTRLNLACWDLRICQDCFVEKSRGKFL